MKRALVLANGEWDGNQEFFQELRAQVDTLVCADGGAEYALQLGLRPDRIFGDLDSLDPKVQERYKSLGIQFVQFPVEKDKTDTHLVFDYLIAEGYQEILLGGALGGRPDHLLGNLLLLNYAHKMGAKVRLVSPTVEVQVMEERLEITGHRGDTFSLIPVDERVRGVNLTGFKYPLIEAEVLRESTLGISNLIESDPALVEVREGTAMIFIVNKSIV